MMVSKVNNTKHATMQRFTFAKLRKKVKQEHNQKRTL